MPQVCGLAAVNFSVRSGIFISAYQPPSPIEVATNHTPSQLALTSRLSLKHCASQRAPFGFTSNM